MTAKEVSSVLLHQFRHIKKHRYTMPNFYNHRNEMDVMTVTKSNKIHEIEIKISRPDFLAEFRTKARKHKLLATGKYNVDRFYFACPKDLISLDEIPDYAGLIYVFNNDYEVIKQAPMLINTSNFVKEWQQRITTRAYWRYVNTMELLESATNRVELLESKLKNA